MNEDSAIIHHQAIAASAGSGKTFQLAQRYIRLLAHQVAPERIIALTFSRKAAGEIFDSIVQYLSLAALSPEEARAMAPRIERPAFEQADFLKLLRLFLDRLHHLHIGTIDSFIVGMARTFPMELGLSMEFDVLDRDGAESVRLRREVLNTIFNHRLIDRGAQHQFQEAFKLTTFGQEEKALAYNLERFINMYQVYYQLLPHRHGWGDEQRIWPNGSPWLTPADDVQGAAERLRALVGQSHFPDPLVQSLLKIINVVDGYTESTPWDATLGQSVVFKELLTRMADLAAGAETILRYRKKEYTLSPEQSLLFYRLLHHLFHVEIRSALIRTRGLYRLLDQYERLYDRRVRRRGRLTFDDAQYLLTGANRYSGGALLSRLPDPETRLYIDYRLDCRLDHWLLDEFQDTSNAQWEVFRNLIDEIVQDPSGRRSFFYVGDVKQAIYGWRGGNARLFGAILEQYGDRIERRPLNTSFRSCEAVIEAVNRVFDVLPAGIFPEGTIERWSALWSEHRAEQGKVPARGYTALLEPDCSGGTYKPTAADRYEVVAALLKEIKPLRRGLSVAILVRTNAAGKEMVDYLREACADLPVAHEGRGIIKDNPVVALLLSLIRFAAHPGDTFAWRHLQMSPLDAFFAERKWTRDRLPLILLRDLHEQGVQGFIRRWGERLDALHPLEPFGRKRLRDLVDAAGEFSGRDHLHAFLSFIDRYQTHEPGSDHVVRVMTIHQAKGLGFDVVMLPDLQSTNHSMISAGHIDFVTARDEDTNRPLWALKMPRKIIAQHDPVLAEQVRIEDENACFDELCVLYVAMTRAKRALYLVTGFAGKTSVSITPAAFLKTQFQGTANPELGERFPLNGSEAVVLYETGTRDWYEEIPYEDDPRMSTEAVTIPEDFIKKPSRRKRLMHVSPSLATDNEEPADLLFAPRLHQSLELGTAVHELFERLGWVDEEDVLSIVEAWQTVTAASDTVQEQAVNQFRNALNTRKIRELLSKPEMETELWREQSFEMVLADEWITGVFDRVHIIRDESDNVIRAVIIDYKSNEVITEQEIDEAAEHYRPQLELYQRVLMKMLKLGPANIDLKLVFTRPGRVCELN